MTPEPYTVEEVRLQLFNQLYTMIRYWSAAAKDYEVIPGINDTEEARMEGLVFSLLANLDGCSLPLPAIDLCLAPCPEDKAYNIEHGDKWYERGQVINDCSLHEEWTAWLKAKRVAS